MQARITTNRPLRIAYTVHTFDMGGLERCVARLVNHLDGERFRPMVVCLSRSGAAAEWIERADVPIVELRKSGGNDPFVVWRLARVLRDHRVDIVHSHNWGTLLETSLARRWARVRVHVHTEHGQGLHDALCGLKRLLRGCATRWALSRADAAVVCAESVRPILRIRSGFPESRIQFIPNGVEDSLAAGTSVEPQALRRSLGVPDESLVVGSLGRLVAVKDFGTAIDAIATLSRRGHEVHLVLVGDGPERDRLCASAHVAGIDGRVHFVGRQENVGDWLRMFDVYVNSSLSEAMSVGILEAMAAGLPIVATDVGDNASLVNGGSPCGIIVPPADAARLAEAIGEVVANEERRRALSYAAKERYVSKYSVESMVRNHEALYLRLGHPRQRSR